MNKNFEKYAELLLKRCLSIKKGQPLLISAPIDTIDFVRVVARIALTLGIFDIYFDLDDEILKHDILNNVNKEDLNTSKFFNKKVYDEYAKKGAAFLILCANNPDIMKDIDDEKIAYSSKLIRTSKPIFKKLQLTNDVPWCIASVSTDSWAKKVLPKSPTPREDLWKLIFKMCLVNTKDPIKEWNNKIENNKKLVDKLNKLKITKLYYKNKLGTNFVIGFDNNIWCGAGGNTKDGRQIIVNMPSEEVFTAPNKYTANGKVYASLPLVYNGSLIEDFWIEFKKGKVINYGAKKGASILKSIFEIKNGNYLGEVALVDTSSPISKSGILFYDTLYDENASCHLALGEAYLECVNNKQNFKKMGINKSETHVDFMIGTKDLNIIAETSNNEKITIMKNGKFKI